MFSFVVHRQGRRVIRWGHFLMTALLLTACSTVAATGLYYLLSERWDLLAPLAGAGAGCITAVLTLLAALCTPLQHLPIVK
jgi:hypothetical protein